MEFPAHLGPLTAKIDKFKTLCYVQADATTAPHKTKLTKTKEEYYETAADVILLVGLTELKAQLCWIDPSVRSPLILSPHALFTLLSQGKERRLALNFTEFRMVKLSWTLGATLWLSTTIHLRGSTGMPNDVRSGIVMLYFRDGSVTVRYRPLNGWFWQGVTCCFASGRFTITWIC